MTERGSWNVEFDDAGAIGRRYRRQDEIGTPYCDGRLDTSGPGRDGPGPPTMTQERIGLGAIGTWLATASRLLTPPPVCSG
jgi:glycyl-tRNA synthetase